VVQSSSPGQTYFPSTASTGANHSTDGLQLVAHVKLWQLLDETLQTLAQNIWWLHRAVPLTSTRNRLSLRVPLWICLERCWLVMRCPNKCKHAVRRLLSHLELPLTNKYSTDSIVACGLLQNPEPTNEKLSYVSKTETKRSRSRYRATATEWLLY